MTANFLAALASFIGHLVVAVALTVAGILAYMRTTPHEEIALIRSGNTAAAIGLAGALIGIAIVLSNAIRISHGIIETLVWALIALVVQVAGHWLVSNVVPRLYAAISEGDLAAAIMKASVAISLGLLNAASMTP